MKAIVLKEFGNVGNLSMREIAMPIISETEVLVRVKAISINPVDVRTRSGSAMASHLRGLHPIILGWDISGIITEIGQEVSKFKVGDEVFGMVNFVGHGKGYAEYVAAPESHLALKPQNQSFQGAAAATLAALTAWQRLVHVAKIKQGDKILIQAASGGVGHYAVQIAKNFKAEVIGVSSNDNRKFVLDLGADQHIAYDKVKVEEAVSSMDIVIDAFSADSLINSLKMVREGGTIISLLPFISDNFLAQAKEKHVSVHYELVRSNGSDMNSIAKMMEDGFLTSHISKVFSFEQMTLAHLEMERGKTVGKIVISLKD
ncbi:MAG: NADP-dependent oxidoreductase [Chitinophagaceae bacterium]|nr:MAG: NADP-dependent oxidoreductase [Chitinophagaceae bacterium]